MLFSKATTVEPLWAHPWCGPADAIGPDLASYLDQGRWNGKQLLPATWVRQARTASRGSKQAYGAHWWLSRRKSRPDLPNDSFSAEGYQGQLLLVAPSQRAVVVRLGQTPKKPGFDANAFGADVLSALR